MRKKKSKLLCRPILTPADDEVQIIEKKVKTVIRHEFIINTYFFPSIDSGDDKPRNQAVHNNNCVP
jgi:hypothetical protein